MPPVRVWSRAGLPAKRFEEQSAELIVLLRYLASSETHPIFSDGLWTIIERYRCPKGPSSLNLFAVKAREHDPAAHRVAGPF